MTLKYLTISILIFICLIIIIKKRKKFKYINKFIGDEPEPIFIYCIVMAISFFWVFILPAIFIVGILYTVYLLFRKLTGL
jgi:O-antigen/teichoic acid export membrane protein